MIRSSCLPLDLGSPWADLTCTGHSSQQRLTRHCFASDGACRALASELRCGVLPATTLRLLLGLVVLQIQRGNPLNIPWNKVSRPESRA